MEFHSKYVLRSAAGRVFDIQTSTDNRFMRLMTGSTGNMQTAAIDKFAVSDSLIVSWKDGEITIPLVRAVDLPVGVVPPRPMFFPRTADLPEPLHHIDPQDPGHLMENNMVPGAYSPTQAAII